VTQRTKKPSASYLLDFSEKTGARSLSSFLRGSVAIQQKLSYGWTSP
jgi:hypothetical protein